jgi:glycosyltransferase involved in cell wall biosynthesis
VGSRGKWPLVTIITAAYNMEALVEETVRSVLDQDYPNLEYIVLDDGSTDRTREVLARYADRARVLAHENMGETRTVNRGFELAQGEIVGVVSADDPLIPGAISRIVEVLNDQPDVVVAYPDWLMIDRDGKVLKEVRTVDYSYVDMVRWHHCVPGPGALFRRSLIPKLEGRDPQFRYVADFDFWLRAGLVGQFARVPKTLAKYRWHAGSASASQQNLLMGEEHLRLVMKLFQLPDLPPDLLRVRGEAFSSACYVAGIVCGNRRSWQKTKYFASALSHAPFKYAGEYRQRLVDMLMHVIKG